MYQQWSQYSSVFVPNSVIVKETSEKIQFTAVVFQIEFFVTWMEQVELTTSCFVD